MEENRKSPYYYTPGQWAQMEDNAKRKYARALVYDFLKKHFLLRKIYNFFILYHDYNSLKPNVIGFQEFLDYTIHKMLECNIGLRNYFFDRRILFDWDGERVDSLVKKEMGEIDKKWLQLIDNEIGK